MSDFPYSIDELLRAKKMANGSPLIGGYLQTRRARDAAAVANAQIYATWIAAGAAVVAAIAAVTDLLR